MNSIRNGSPIRLMIAALVLFLPALAFAAKNSLQVQCVDAAGAPVAGAKVFLQNVETGAAKDKKSDAKGMLKFDKVDDGVYRVLSRKEGFAPAIKDLIVLKGDKDQSLNLKFEPGADRKLYFEAQEIGQQAMEALQAGVNDLRASKLADAENKLKTAVSLNPTNPEAHLNLALAYLQQKKWDEAQGALKGAIDMADVFAELKPRPGSSPDVFKPMRERAQDLHDKVPGFRLRSEANDLMNDKKFPEAIAKLKESLKYFPDDADIYYNIAISHAQARQLDEAAATVDKALSLKPTEKAFLDLKKQIAAIKQNEILSGAQKMVDEGEALYKNKDFAGALAKFEEAKKVVPEKNYGLMYSLIAKAHAGLNNYDKTVEAYKQAIAASPDKPEYKKMLAQYYMSQKKYDEALSLYAEGGTGGAPDQTLFALGQQLSGQGNGEVAQLAYEKAIQANPNHAEAHYELGMLLYFSKQNDAKAKDLLSKYVKIGQHKDHVENTTKVLVVLSKRMTPPKK